MSPSKFVLFIAILCILCSSIGWAEIPEWTFKRNTFTGLAQHFKGTKGYYRNNGNLVWYKVDYVADTQTPMPGPISAGGSLVDISEPYYTYRTTGHELLLYNGINTVTVVPYNEDIWVQGGYISDDYIVWEQWDILEGGAEGPRDIYLYNVVSGSKAKISNNTIDPPMLIQSPAIGYPYIAWEQSDEDGDPDTDNGLDIMLYNINTGQTTQITDQGVVEDPDDTQPHVSNRYVVWERHGSYIVGGLWAYDLLSGTSAEVAPGYFSSQGYDTYGENIVWNVYSPSSGGTIYFYNGSEPNEVPFPYSVGNQVAVYGNNIWADYNVALAKEPEYHWINDMGGRWDEQENWDRDSYPNSPDSHVFFDLSSVYTVTDYTATAQTISVSEGYVSFDNGTSLTLSNETSSPYSLVVDAFMDWKSGTLSSPTCSVGNQQSGELNISDGATISITKEVVLGNTPFSTGQVVVTGTGSTLAQTDEYGLGFTVGNIGPGSLEIQQSGSVTSATAVQIGGQNSPGTVIVDGTASSLFVTSATIHPPLNVLGDGELYVQNGGMAYIDSGLNVGDSVGDAGLYGKVMVAGSGSFLHAGSTTAFDSLSELGRVGSGAMEIRNGGSAQINRLWLGSADEGTTTSNGNFRTVASAFCTNVNNIAHWSTNADDIKAYLWVRDDQSRLEVPNTLRIGHSDSSFLYVDNAGWVDCGDMYIGKWETSVKPLTNNSVWVKGANSGIAVSNDLNIYGSTDFADFAGLLISDGGIVSCDLAILGRVRIHQIASDPVPVFRDEPWAGYLYVTGSGSEFQVLDTLHAGNGGHAEINIFLGGKISAGSQVEITGLNPGYGGSIYIGSSSVLQSPQVNVREFGHLLGSGTVIGNVNNLGGHVAPGFSPGTLTIQGDYTQDNAGVLDIEIGPDSQDILNVTGNVDIAGSNIRMTFVRGYAPSTGEAISFIQAGGTIKAKPNPQYEIINLADGFSYSTQVDGGVVQLVAQNDAVYVPTPDLNNSDSIDMADYAYFAQEWLTNSCGTCYGADLTGDGNVGVDDFIQFVDSWMTDMTP